MIRLSHNNERREHQLSRRLGISSVYISHMLQYLKSQPQLRSKLKLEKRELIESNPGKGGLWSADRH